ncbi:MAG: hypothetical protein IV086_06305 [Hyphomonadaceae bacterium]|nr:MAG: hypothetical protein FD160_2871 [Caulobacteraceae bacterium]MBT9445293.1 hypothetical protein [Hyphomonadaceae bacterium]TPW07765.1 MAG: hypothetical protein FD124_876 [Alphaproteobacteria bacterium]
MNWLSRIIHGPSVDNEAADAITEHRACGLAVSTILEATGSSIPVLKHDDRPDAFSGSRTFNLVAVDADENAELR